MPWMRLCPICGTMLFKYNDQHVYCRCGWVWRSIEDGTRQVNRS